MAGTLSFSLVRRFETGFELRATGQFELDGGDVLVLFGPSGSGKSSLLRLLAGLDAPDQGRIDWDGVSWVDTAAGRLVPARLRRVGLLFQEAALFPHLDVAGNIAFGLRELGPGDRDGRVAEMLDLIGLRDLGSRDVDDLSGGERQRVALARTLAVKPDLVLLDEPFASLDGPAREILRAETRRLLVRSGTPAIVVTHDRVEALSLGDGIAVMIGGEIRQTGPVAEVFNRPADVDVARSVGVETVLSATVEKIEEGVAVVRAGEVELAVHDPGDLMGDVWACIPADEVTIEPGESHRSSARNHLRSRVTEVIEEGPVVRVVMDAGVRLVALVTRRSAAELQLRPEAEVVAVIKALGIRLVKR